MAVIAMMVVTNVILVRAVVTELNMPYYGDVGGCDNQW